jgi:hypothetical protein
MKPTRLVAAAIVIPIGLGCASSANDLATANANANANATASREDAFTSATATLLDFEFDGEVLTAGGEPQATIRDQMRFTIGQLNGSTGVGRLDKLVLSKIVSEVSGDATRVRYHAKLPVALAKTVQVGSRFTLVLPKRADFFGQTAFFEKYKSSACTASDAHDLDSGIYWYYYRPNQAGCSLADSDVVRMSASVTVSRENSKNSYPEYDKIWSDNTLNVIAIFGKVVDGATTSADRGIWSHGRFVSALRAEFPNAVVSPATTATNPGIETPDVTIATTLANGRRVTVTSFLVDNVRQGGPAFENRYNTLSGDADIIVYNGHAGLGQNVRALARMGSFKPNTYQIIYMNGCDTFAYVDGTLAQVRAKLNPTDPAGTKFMEILTNSMPPTWDSLPNNTLSLVRDLTANGTPLPYAALLSHFDQSGFVSVTGDEDNVFKP